jgi:hypothetical protein
MQVQEKNKQNGQKLVTEYYENTDYKMADEKFSFIFNYSYNY